MFSFVKNLMIVPTKMVFVVRTDLKMGQGKVATQCAHAAVSLYESALKSPDVPLKSWLRSGQPKIVLKITENGERALLYLHDEAKAKNLNVCLIYDAGRTQVEAGTLTVLGVGPGKIEDLDELTKNLKLL